MNIFKNFFVSPQENEVIETKIYTKGEIRPAIIGSILDNNEKPLEGVFIALYKMDKSKEKTTDLVTFTYSDNYGNFILAPLDEGELYNVKIYKSDGKTRVLEANIAENSN